MNFSLQVPVKEFELPHPRGDGTFKISVARVAHVPAGGKVPVLYVLDGDIGFALAAEIARMRGIMGMQPTAMIVGIGYGADFLEFAKLRTADLTPLLSAAGRAAMGNLASFIGDQDGGADRFLDFLTNTLAPEIARCYPEASDDDRILFGHSLGGLFTAYALLTRPGAFRSFVANSPSLWWDGFAINGHLAAFAEKLAALLPAARADRCRRTGAGRADQGPAGHADVARGNPGQGSRRRAWSMPCPNSPPRSVRRD